MADRRHPAEVTIARLKADWLRWRDRLNQREWQAVGVVIDAWQAIADKDREDAMRGRGRPCT